MATTCASNFGYSQVISYMRKCTLHTSKWWAYVSTQTHMNILESKSIFTYSNSILTHILLILNSSCGFLSLRSFQSESIAIHGHHALAHCSPHEPNYNLSFQYWRPLIRKYLPSKNMHHSFGHLLNPTTCYTILKFQVFFAFKNRKCKKVTNSNQELVSFLMNYLAHYVPLLIILQWRRNILDRFEMV